MHLFPQFGPLSTTPSARKDAPSPFRAPSSLMPSPEALAALSKTLPKGPPPPGLMPSADTLAAIAKTMPKPTFPPPPGLMPSPEVLRSMSRFGAPGAFYGAGGLSNPMLASLALKPPTASQAVGVGANPSGSRGAPVVPKPTVTAPKTSWSSFLPSWASGRGDSAHGLVTKEAKGLETYLEAHHPESDDVLTFKPDRGDVYCYRGPEVAKSSFEELAHDVFCTDPGPVVKNLFKARIWLGDKLGLDEQPTAEDMARVWSDPERKLKQGDKLFIFDVVHRGEDSAILHQKNGFEDVFLTLKKDGDKLYFGSFVEVEGIGGEAYWAAVKPFHGVVTDNMISNTGRNLRERTNS